MSTEASNTRPVGRPPDYDKRPAFSRRIIDARLRAGLTQDQLAKLVGQNRVVVTKWEHGREPLEGNAVELADALGGDPADYRRQGDEFGDSGLRAGEGSRLRGQIAGLQQRVKQLERLVDSLTGRLEALELPGATAPEIPRLRQAAERAAGAQHRAQRLADRERQTPVEEERARRKPAT